MRAARGASIVAFALAASVGVAACGRPNRPAGVVVFASGADLESANPLLTVHGLSRQVQRYALFTTLARYDSALAPVPYLATHWEWSPDRTVLSFGIHGDLAWHDRVPTTARDVAYTLLVARDPRTGYPRAADLAAVDTVIALTDTSVAIAFAEPQASFPSVLCELPILPAHLLDTIPRGEMRHSPFNLAPVGNGPFRFVDRVAGQRWTFERNAAFPASLGGPPAIDRLVVVVVDEPSTKLAGLASGELDFAGIAPSMAALARRDPTLRVLDYPILLSTALVFNTHRAPFDDVRVREAVDLAIDRPRIVQAALAGFGTPASGALPPASPFAVSRATVRDTARADSLLDASGWRRGAGGRRERDGRPFTVELLTVGSGDNTAEQLVQDDLRGRGITVEIRQLEMGAFLSRARSSPKTFDLLVTGIPGDLSLSQLGAMFDGRQRGGALDYGDYHSAALDSAFRAARRATDATRAEAWRRVQETIDAAHPVAWLYHSRGLQGVTARLDGVTIDLRGELESVARWRPRTP